MILYYAFTQNSVLKSILPNASEPNWQTSMLYSDICSLIYVNETICMVICPSTRFKLIILWPGMNHLMSRLSQNASCGWGGLVPLWVLKHSFFSLRDCWWLYNIQLKTSKGSTLSAPFWCLCQKFSLSPLYLSKTLLYKALRDAALSLALDWIPLLLRPRIPASFHSTTTFHTEIRIMGLQNIPVFSEY